jgi:para-nitrobenzyl esterase
MFCVVFCCLPLAVEAQTAAPFVVKTASGTVTGERVNGSDVTAFEGIPYAAPPVGELRWKPPQPPVAWKGVRHADHFSASCMQVVRGEHLPWTREFMAQYPISEDCLYLNVWTAAKAHDTAKLRPVLLWIHGGGLVEGSAAPAAYNGAAMAKRGLVFVSINYRLGAFGFMAHPALAEESPAHASGDYGLLDVVAALRWVHENIAAFGGDPARVTIDGQSSGSTAVIFMTASPLAKGLFRGAIAESGADLDPPTSISLKDAEENGVAFAAKCGERNLKALRALSAESLLQCQRSAGMPFRPDIDGLFLTRGVADVFAAGMQNDVPTISGMNADEGSASSGYGKISVADYAALAKRRYGAGSAEFLELYPGRTDVEAGESLKQSSRDREKVSVYLWAQVRAKTSHTPAYTYYFSRAIPWPQHPEFGAFHSAEIPYALDNLPELQRPYEPIDYKLEREVSGYWEQFVRSGEPNKQGLPVWTPYEEGHRVVMELGVKTGMRPVASERKFQFWKSHLEKP